MAAIKNIVFHKKYNALMKEMRIMTSFVREELEITLDFFKKPETENYQYIIEKDEYVNKKEAEILQATTIIMAQEQPVASDLRELVSILNVVSDLERIGDYAVNMIKSSQRNMYSLYELSENCNYLPRMLEEDLEHYNKTMEAFFTKNAQLSQQMREADADIDALYIKVRSMVAHKLDQHEPTGLMLCIFELSRDLERLGDHLVHICAHNIYQLTGKRAHER